MPALSFMTGGELECSFAPPGSKLDAGFWQYTVLNPGELPPVDPTLLSDARQDVRTMIRTLRPSSDEEEANLERWRAQEELTPSDAVNFRVYGQNSKPTLARKTSTVGMQRSDLLKQYDCDVEFRHGNEELQVGYYDNPGVSELRLTPRDSAIYTKRSARLLQNIAATATVFGLRARLLSEHRSTSAFLDEKPLFVDPEESLDSYLSACTGMRALYQESALYDPSSTPHVPSPLIVSPWRSSNMRIMPGRVELRLLRKARLNPRHLHTIDPERAFRFMLTGMAYGLTHATDEDRARIPTADILFAKPGADFERSRDHYLLRTLGGWSIARKGFAVQDSCNDAQKALLALTGKSIPDGAGILRILAGTTTLDGTQISMPPEAYHTFISEVKRMGHDWTDVPLSTINANLGRISVTAGRAIAWTSYPERNPIKQREQIRKAVALPIADPDKYAELLAAIDR